MFNILFHSIKTEESVQVIFLSPELETNIYETLQLNDYKIYQFIDYEFKYNMNESELNEKDIDFVSLEREKKIWFGLYRKKVADLLILPNDGFFYPYQFGHYLYLFTQRAVEKAEFEDWINSEFLNRFVDFDDTYAGLNKQDIQLMNENDYLIITNYDYQKEFGVIANNKVIEQLISKLKSSDINLSDDKYVNYIV
jgi:hypothetical protein